MFSVDIETCFHPLDTARILLLQYEAGQPRQPVLLEIVHVLPCALVYLGAFRLTSGPVPLLLCKHSSFGLCLTGRHDPCRLRSVMREEPIKCRRKEWFICGRFDVLASFCIMAEFAVGIGFRDRPLEVWRCSNSPYCGYIGSVFRIFVFLRQRSQLCSNVLLQVTLLRCQLIFARSRPGDKQIASRRKQKLETPWDLSTLP